MNSEIGVASQKELDIQIKNLQENDSFINEMVRILVKDNRFKIASESIFDTKTGEHQSVSNLNSANLNIFECCLEDENEPNINLPIFCILWDRYIASVIQNNYKRPICPIGKWKGQNYHSHLTRLVNAADKLTIVDYATNWNLEYVQFGMLFYLSCVPICRLGVAWIKTK